MYILKEKFADIIFYSLFHHKEGSKFVMDVYIPASKTHIITNILFLKDIKVELSSWYALPQTPTKIPEDLYNLIKSYV
jgi:hypothetical protein